MDILVLFYCIYIWEAFIVFCWIYVNIGICLQIKQINCNTITIGELETVKADFSVSSIMMGTRF